VTCFISFIFIYLYIYYTEFAESQDLMHSSVTYVAVRSSEVRYCGIVSSGGSRICMPPRPLAGSATDCVRLFVLQICSFVSVLFLTL